MRKFLITNPSFTGTIELLFNELGLLCKIDMSNAVLPVAAIKKFKQAAPATIAELEAALWKTETTTVVEADFEVSFEMFWKAYDKKINKLRCVPLWNKLPKSEQVKAWAGVPVYLQFLAETHWRKQADPENYLRNQMWNNEWK